MLFINNLGPQPHRAALRHTFVAEISPLSEGRVLISIFEMTRTDELGKFIVRQSTSEVKPTLNEALLDFGNLIAGAMDHAGNTPPHCTEPRTFAEWHDTTNVGRLDRWFMR